MRILAIFALVLIPHVAGGQTPDFTGIWLSAESEPGNIYKYDQNPLPMQPWSEERWKYNIDAQGNYRNEMNPEQSKCFPRGMTMAWLSLQRPIEIMQSPRRVFILFEWNHEIRQIWTDGRDHPEGFGKTWMGHSIGKWEGDTLVVDTIGINEHSWLDRNGHVHSDALHVTERIRKVDNDTLQLDITFEDPKAYTKKFSARRLFKRASPDWEVEEVTLCEDKLLGNPVPIN
jgi:hypothetical protein